MTTACVILAAGEGKRMKSGLPKVLHEVCGKPMIYYPVSLALKKGFDPIIVVCSKKSQRIQEYLKRQFGKKVQIAIQDPPKGTGHAVLCAQKELKNLKGKLAILYGDVPALSSKDLLALSRAGRNSSVALLSCHLDDPSGYGRIVRNTKGQVERIVEHLDATKEERRIEEINAGIYLVDLPFVFEALDRVRRNNAQEEYYLTDLIEEAKNQGLRVRAALRQDPLSLMGVNSRLELARAARYMNQTFIVDLMTKGVTFIDPDRTVISHDTKIGKDSVIHPDCYFYGEVSIGRDCRIGPGAVIENSKIGNSVEIKPWSVLEGCSVGVGSAVGPFARLRPGAKLGKNCRVGNFVEIKKSVIGEGSKASHLSYLGDAIIGRGVNVGAGTITCNYDGAHKHQTEIDDGVFVGSDTQFVAPVKIGKNAVIGAGTTVTQDVPAESLTVSRVRQKNILGYTKKKKK
jgi:bifunctional UDP-N-acetylglucosamine pyrophosphorylase/glucosamine-1-phosphate N-acetyltransferase